MDGPIPSMPVTPNLSGTFGPGWLIALRIILVVLSTFFGLLVGVLAIAYYGTNKDGWKMRSFVSLQLALNFTVLAITGWQFISPSTGLLVTGRNLLSGPDQNGGSHMTPMSEIAPLVAAGVIIVLSQFFIAYHVFLLDSRWPGLLCSILTAFFAALGFVRFVWLITEVTNPSSSTSTTTASLRALYVIQGICLEVADLIAGCFLYQHFSKIGKSLSRNQGVQKQDWFQMKSKIMVSVNGLQIAFPGPSADLIAKGNTDFITWIQVVGTLANCYVFTTLTILTTRDSLNDTLSKPHDVEVANG